MVLDILVLDILDQVNLNPIRRPVVAARRFGDIEAQLKASKRINRTGTDLRDQETRKTDQHVATDSDNLHQERCHCAP